MEARYMKKNKPLFLFIAFLSCSTLISQETPDYYTNKYKGEYTVKLKDHCYTNIEIKKGELKIERHFVQKNVYLDKFVSGMGNISLKYTPPFTEVVDVDAYTLVPKAGLNEYEKQKVRSITDKEVMSDNIFYGGDRAKIFSYSGLQKGAISSLEYTEKVYEPKLIGSEIFRGFALTEDQLLELRYDEEVDVDIKYFNCSEEDFTYTKELKGGQIIHRWSPKDHGKIKDEDGMPEYLSIMPHIVYRINSYTYKGETIPILRNTADLHNWYKSLLKEVNADQDENIKHLTDSIIAGATSQEEKTERIFKWIQSNIKYIAFEDGLGGFKPRLPSHVFDKRYGDCKDMSCLTVNMLNHAGVSAYPTWIGTRSKPYSYADVPSPLADNHMIVAASLNDQIIFLDPTNSDLPFPLPSSFIQGKEALIGVSNDSFAIKTVPIVPSSQTVTYDSVFAHLEGLNLKGVGLKKYRGYYADNLNRNLNNNDKKQLNEMLKYHVRKGNNKCISSGHKVVRNNSHTSVEYSFDVPQYAYADGDQLFINLNLEKVMDDFKIKDDREHPFEYRYAYKIIRKYSLQIPEGYTATYIPEDASQTFDDFSFHLKYKQVKNQIDYYLEIDVNTLLIENKDFDAWNSMIKDLNRNYNETIVLKKS